MQLDYDSIRRIHRLEKNRSKIVEVDLDFYNQLNDFVKTEKAKYLDSLKDFSTGRTRDFGNIKK